MPTTATGSDSEDDSDYVPSNGNGRRSDGSDTEAPAPKRPRTTSDMISQGGLEETAADKKTGDGIYAAFKASLTDPAPQLPQAPVPVETVKVVKRYRFAGEDIEEVKEVPADSEEAKKWPLWTSSSDPPAASSSSTKQASSLQAGGSASSTPTKASIPAKTPAKRPGPRKAKSKLADIPKKEQTKRLTTLDKSAMDWRAHVQSDAGAGMKEELEANRRGGGYLEKVEFLKRVEARKDDVLDSNKGKRRR